MRAGALFIVVSFTAFFSMSASAQSESDTTRRTFSEATYFGGGINLRFGDFTDVSLAPRLGYFIDKNNRFSVGGGINYRYFADNRLGFNSSFYGFSLFQRSRLIEGFFTHAEYQRLNVPLAIGGVLQDGDDIPRVWVPALLLGGGYALEMGDGVFLLTTVLYEVTNNPNNFYQKRVPIVSVSVSTGF